MTNKISEIAKQAMIEAQEEFSENDDLENLHELYNKCFVQLIIRECMDEVIHFCSKDKDREKILTAIQNKFGMEWMPDICDCDLDAKDDCELCDCGKAGYFCMQ